jgi:hypothetical protein
MRTFEQKEAIRILVWMDLLCVPLALHNRKTGKKSPLQFPHSEEAVEKLNSQLPLHDKHFVFVLLLPHAVPVSSHSLSNVIFSCSAWWQCATTRRQSLSE